MDAKSRNQYFSFFTIKGGVRSDSLEELVVESGESA